MRRSSPAREAAPSANADRPSAKRYRSASRIARARRTLADARGRAYGRFVHRRRSPDRKLLVAIAAAFALTFGLSTLLKSCADSSSGTATPASAAPNPVSGLQPSPLDKVTISYTKLNELTAAHRITDATIDTSRGMARLTVRAKPGSQTQELRSFFAGEPDKLADRLADAGADVTVKNARAQMPWAVKLLLWLSLGAGFAFLLFRMQRRQTREQGVGGVSGGLRSDAMLGTPPAVRFSEVAGCDEVVEEVAEFKEFLVDPAPFRRLGARMPSGLILYGPPGTGKTLVAKALAGEAGASFFAVSGSDFVDRYVGMGASRIRDLFKRARAAAPAIIFIDEIDAVGKKRGGEPGSDSEREQTLNQLLVEMDGFNSKDRVVVAAATNRLDTLDEALLRAGRFSRQVQVGLPDKVGRRQILEVHTKGTPLDADVDLDRLAEVTASMSGATLADLVNEAAIMAARAKRSTVTQADLEEGQLRALAGPEKKNRTMSEEERELIAYHEAGHVLCAELSAEHEKAQRATIKPRGQAAGLALYGQTDRAIHSAQYLHERMLCALGGRAAEWVRYGKVSTGAANDLEQVNRVARQAVEELGFSAATGQITLSGARGQASDRTREVIDGEVERILADAYAEAVHHLEAHRAKLDALAAALLACEDLSRIEIVAALAAADGGEPAPRPRPRALAPATAPALHRPAPAPAPAVVQPPHPPRLRDVLAERLRSSGRRRMRPAPAPVAAAQSTGVDAP
jgi:cell division protease FtsH